MIVANRRFLGTIRLAFLPQWLYGYGEIAPSLEAVKMLTPDDLEDYLRTHGIAGEVLRLDVPTPTVAAAARAVGVTPERIVKTVVFMVQSEPVLVIASGTAKVNTRALAQHLGVSRRRIRVARPDEVLAATGYPVGAVPPLGHRQPLPAVLDESVLQYEVVYAGGGAENALLKIAPQALLQAVRPAVAAVQAPVEG